MDGCGDITVCIVCQQHTNGQCHRVGFRQAAEAVAATAARLLNSPAGDTARSVLESLRATDPDLVARYLPAA